MSQNHPGRTHPGPTGRSRPRLGRRAPVRAVALVVLAGLLLASGCGLKGASQFAPAADPGSIKPEPSLKDARIVVGSKDFTEQLILGKMAVIALRTAGADVVDQTNITGSVAVRQALLRGDVDANWEYTGTAWISYLGKTKPVIGREAQWKAVRQDDLAKHHLEWFAPAPMNNTYAFAIRSEEAKKLGVSKLSDLKKLPKKDLTFCVESEFASRDDGFEPMLKTYGVPLGSKVPRGNIRTMSTGVVYDATDKGRCNFGEVFTTDGRIKALDLKVLADDKHFFPNYNVAFNVREDIARKYPRLRAVMEPLTAKLTTATMLELNAKVDVDGEDPGLVARDWMRAKGFVK
ncbi:glycine betaine ABC transporter substrate-binding protein [Actinopolymorpha sp. NPDC004070]|uniref:glycine betaine ABC transporter substrate-binding protein n=1 Tax=Actinopolymorpha sp. NPDC004070 TaxID=3154548 RepID=UPI0033B0526C